ncbi:hypothetical protein [uncultured Litoreibacter sp.]|uniref:hypothetical protein n=1 Tax=uncultured Litoreibacter sp. TaxID=1392394 RepID=UPI00262104E0|nr:hypothetical protein [uncultured Litoreibacter sp.]
MFGFMLQKQLRAAAIQCEAVHEDISAGMFRALSNLNVATRTYYNSKIFDSRGDFFAELPVEGLDARYVSYEGAPAWDAVADAIRRQRANFIFANTFQRDGVARWMKQFDLPIMGIVHNPDILRESEHAMDLVREGRVFAFGLAQHVVTKIVDTVPELSGRCAVYNPAYWMDPARNEFDPDDNRRTILIPGAVDYKNRDFERLVAYLASGKLKTEVPVVFQVFTGGPDRQRLEQDIAKNGLEDHFELAPLDPVTGKVPHNRYLAALRRCDALMLLLPESRKDYLTNKLTTGVAAGMGSMRPIIAPDIYGRVYGVPTLATPTDSPFDISSLDLSAANLRAHQSTMSKLWNNVMFDNQIAAYKGLVKLGILKG